MDVTLDPDTVSIVVKLQEQDPTTETWVDIPGAATAAIADVGHSHFKVYPGIDASANKKVSDVLSRNIRVVSTHTAGTTMTYSVSVELLA